MSGAATPVGTRLAAAFDPRGIALVGASSRETNLGLRFARALDRHGFGGNLAVVNRTGEEAGGIKGYTACADIDGPVDLGVVMVGFERAERAVEELRAIGAGVALVFTSGFAEVGDEGARRQERLLARARELGITLVGPNCVGIANFNRDMCALATGFAFRPKIEVGGLSIVTQSGGVAGLVAERAQDLGIGLSHMATTGNEAEVTAAEVVEYLVAEGTTEQLALYLEAVRDPIRLAAALEAARARGIPVSVFKAGSGPTTSAAAAAHTGAIVGEDASFDALFARTGATRARELDELLLVPPIRAAIGGPVRTVGVLSTSGGAAVAVADACEDVGLELPPLSEDGAARLGEVIPGFASFENPVDISGMFVVDMDQLRVGLEALVDEPRFDALVMVQTVHPPETAARIAEIVTAAADPGRMAIAWMAGEQTLIARRELRKAGFAVCESAGILARALASAGRGPAPGLELVPLGSSVGSLDGPPSAALARLAELGAPVAPMARAGDAAAAAAAAAELGFPVAIKADSERIAHKTELGGVIAGVADANAAAAAFAALDAQGLAADGVLVQAQVDGSRELLMALRADPIFGLVLAIGIGGVLTEAVEKAAIVLPAFTAEAIAEGVREADLEAFFGPYRGAADVDLEALSRIANALLELGRDLGPDLAHLELNPVIVDQAGAPWLVDALVDMERKDP